jgi:hypothetical protein
LWRTFGSTLKIERATLGLIPETPDALGTLIDAGLVAVGNHLTLAQGSQPRQLGSSAVSALATSLATPVTVNGGHLWRPPGNGRTLAQLRAELASDGHPQ